MLSNLCKAHLGVQLPEVLGSTLWKSYLFCGWVESGDTSTAYFQKDPSPTPQTEKLVLRGDHVLLIISKIFNHYH